MAKTRRTIGKPQPGDEPYRRDITDATKVQLQALQSQHDETRRVLDALRRSRKARSVGTLEVPKHLQAGIVITDARDVERR